MKKIILLACVALTCSCLLGQSTKIAGEYTYTYGDNESLVEAKNLCRTMAIRNAIESCTVYIQSTTTIEDFQLKNDLIQAISAGYIERITVDEETVQDRTVHYSVSGYVNPASIRNIIDNMMRTATKELPSKDSKGKVNGSIMGMEFVCIPGGSFLMGSPPSEEGREDDEGPQHQVSIQPFYMMSTEVTQAQWEAVMKNNPSYFKGNNLPVETVSWNDVHEFIEKLNKMDPGKGYRLPSEAEWEYACRAGTTTRFYTGNSETDMAQATWYLENSEDQTHPVGRKEPNAWGLYDMHGNVIEWCEDQFHYDYSVAPTDGSVWLYGEEERVARGGRFDKLFVDCRSAQRDYVDPYGRYVGFGFRLVRSQ